MFLQILLRIFGPVASWFRASMALDRTEGVVPWTVKCEEVRILQNQGVETSQQLVVLDQVVVGSDIGQLPHLVQIPMIEIETSAAFPRRTARRSLYDPAGVGGGYA